MIGLEAKELIKDYGPFRAVAGVSFRVQKGEVLGFLGPNGAGKSTTMKMLTGFITPTAGSALICGTDMAADPLTAKKQIGYLPERGPLYGEMTAVEFLYFAGRAREISGKRLRTTIDHVIEVCRIEEIRNRLLSTLSKGYRQRVGLAQAIMHDPPCLILDEPTDGLDPNQKDVVRDLIRSMRKDKAIILSTHILEEVEALCSRVIIVNRGKILLDETPADMLRRHPHWGAIRLELAPGQMGKAKKIFAAEPRISEQTEEGSVLVLVPKPGEPIDRLVAEAVSKNGLGVESINRVPARLEDVFREVTLPGKK
jgi:ABC-2 type transport system ATP-binding protein